MGINEHAYDAVIVGGGPAGLVAATYLGRFRRRALVFDTNESRARFISTSHNCPGFPEGIGGEELLDRLRRHSQAYGAVRIEERVQAIERRDGWFEVRSQGLQMRSRFVILATGVVDSWPEMAELDLAIKTGRIRACPVCDAHETIGKRIAVTGPPEKAWPEARYLSHFTRDITVLANASVDREMRVSAEANGIEIYEGLLSVTLCKDQVQVVLASGLTLHFDAIYTAMGCANRSELAAAMNARRDADGGLVVDQHLRTSVDGLYAIGDVAKALNQIAVGFGHAAIAATDIHNGLLQTDQESG